MNKIDPNILPRKAEIHRQTSETDIRMMLNLDGNGDAHIKTGIPFFDHMLYLFTCHSFFDLSIEANGDIDVDYHHTVEDMGIVLGMAVNQAIGNKMGISRYGTMFVPMDESLVQVVLDYSGRPFLSYNAPRAEPIGLFSFQLVEEFLRAFSVHAGITLHVIVLSGKDSHHIAEAIFKAFSRALSIAVSKNLFTNKIPSSKGVI